MFLSYKFVLDGPVPVVSVRAQRTTATIVHPKAEPLAIGGSRAKPKKECGSCAAKSACKPTLGDEVSLTDPFSHYLN